MLVYDHTLLTEPNLLIPGKKPIDPFNVEIDWEHPDTLGLKVFILFSGSVSIDLVNNVVLDRTPPLGTVVIEGNLMLRSTIPDSRFVEMPSADYGDITSDLLTVMFKGRFVDASNSCLLDKTLGNSAAYRLFMHHPSGNTRFRLFTSGGATNIDAPSALSVNAAHTVTGTYDGSFMRVYQNGVQKNSVGNTGNVTTSTDAITTKIPGVTTEVNFEWAGIWERCLDKNEVMRRHVEPYQIIKAKM